MKLCTFLSEGKQKLGASTDQGIIDVKEALKAVPTQGVPITIMEVIEGGQAAQSKLDAFIKQVSASPHADFLLNEDELTWEPVVTHPNKIICVGLNYRKHADETNSPYPDTPILFNKFNNTLTGHLQDIAVPKVTEKMDYEVELGIVIGKTAKYVSEQDALDYVFGYTTVNDLSARDLQMRTAQWLLGKSCDDFSPVGPYVVTSEEVGDPQNLQVRTTMNGEERQNSNTNDMIFSCAEIVSYISQHMTLSPGDLILTGTPFGVILGYPADKQVWIKPGDEVTVEVEKIGALTNRFVEDQ